MILAMNTIFSRVIPKDLRFTFFPYLHLPFINQWNTQEKTKPFDFPYINDSIQMSEIKPSEFKGSITLRYGCFIRLYSDLSLPKFDYLITNFFLDTTENIIDLISLIYKNLMTEGLWINAGPLTYHNVKSIPYTYSMILKIIESFGFLHIKNEVLYSNKYFGDSESDMKIEIYNFPLDIWRKK
jgi:carnosine N-methyltransferase